MTRRLFKFLLDENKPHEGRLVEYVRWLRSQRIFVTTIRRALQLVGTLDENDISELERQYPLLIEEIRGKARAEVKPPDLSGIEDIKKQVDMLQALMLKQDVGSPNGLVMSSGLTGGIKPMGGFKSIAMPTFDDEDDEDTVVIKRGDPKDAGEKWLADMLAFAAKPAEINPNAAPLNLRTSSGRRESNSDSVIVKRTVQ